MKKAAQIISIFILFFLPNWLLAQEWQKTYDLDHTTSLISVAQTSDNFIWSVGYVANNSISGSDALLLKCNQNGDTIFSKRYSEFSMFHSLFPKKDNGIYVQTNNAGETIINFDKNGNEIWRKSVNNQVWGGNIKFFNMANDQILITERKDTINKDTINFRFTYLDVNGQEIWVKNIKFLNDYSLITAAVSNDSLIVHFSDLKNAIHKIKYSISQNVVIESKKIDIPAKWTTITVLEDAYVVCKNAQDDEAWVSYIKNDKLVWKKEIVTSNKIVYNSFEKIIENKNGDVALAGFETINSTDAYGFIEVFDKNNGKIKSYQQFTSQKELILTGLIQSQDDYYIACGSKDFYHPKDFTYFEKAIIIKTKAEALKQSIIGKVVFDYNKNCERDNSEPIVKDFNIVAQNASSQKWYSTIDNAGNFQILVDTGTYNLKVETLSPYIKQTCDSVFEFKTINTNLENVELFLQKTSDCSYLTVDLGSQSFRPCFNSTLRVKYKNNGAGYASNPYIDVKLDQNLTYESSTIPAINLGNSIYRFFIGDMPGLSFGTFSINVKVACDNSLLNKTLCNTAHIYPDSLCMPAGNGKIVTNGTCNGTQIEFSIKNESSTPMSSSKNYLVIEDDVMYLQGNFNLNPNEIKPIAVTAKSGKTYRLIAEQTNPIYGSLATTAFENCNVSASPSTGFINQFAQGDDSPFEDVDCRVVTASYDPNDKQAVPQGVQNQHYIAKNTDIEYTIRFQNKGTDTAFLVVIKDTLSQYLDPATIQPGASSHPYRFDLTDKGIAKFIFSNIQLPHQKVNDEGSNGFVKFRIKQKQNLPNGTSIKNKAAIYFDFNDPIITNETFHTIGENWLMIIPIKEVNKEAIEVKIYPNPFSESTTIELDGEYNDLIFNVFDVNGRLLRSKKFNGNSLNFQRNGLDGGMYIYEILSENKALQKGKIVIF